MQETTPKPTVNSNSKKNEPARILHVNMDNIRPSGVFTLLYGMLPYLPGNITFDFLGDFEENSFAQGVRAHGGRIFATPHNRLHILKWPKIMTYSYRVFKNSKYRIVHIAADTSFKALFFAIPARIAGVQQVIVESHNSSIGGQAKALKRTLHFLFRPFVRYVCDIPMACSDEAAEWFWPENVVNSEDFRIITNGVDLDRFAFRAVDRNEFRRELCIRNDSIIIGHVSNFTFAKNPHFILEVFREAYAQDNRVVLLLVGESAEKQQILENVTNESYGRNIRDVGRLNNVAKAYSAMDVYFQPSLYEGQPIAALEAAASGLSVWLSDRISASSHVSSNVHSLSLEVPPTIWATKLLDNITFKTTHDRAMASQELIGSSADIRSTLREFLALYGVAN